MREPNRDPCMAEIESIVEQSVGLDPASLGATAFAQAVKKRIAALGGIDIDAYLVQLRKRRDEVQNLAEELVVPETWFFRDGQPLRCLRHYLRRRPSQSQVLRVLSVGCSTGEEPYSIAMMLLDEGMHPASFHVVASDLSRQALHSAQQGAYSEWSFRENAPEFAAMRTKYFEKAGQLWCVGEEVRRSVHFRWANLAAPDFLAGESPFEVVFCRNVLIYFRAQSRRNAVANLRRLLCPGGLLYVGHAEARVGAEGNLQPYDREFPFAFSPDGGDRPIKPAPLAAPALELPNSLPRKEKPLRFMDRPEQPIARPIPQTVSAVSPNPMKSSAGAFDAASKEQAEAAVVTDARRAADAGDLQKAERTLLALIQNHSANAEAQYLMGIVRQAQGDASGAERFFQRSLYLDPSNREPLVHLMLLAERRGDLHQAANFRRRLGTRPGDAGEGGSSP